MKSSENAASGTERRGLLQSRLVLFMALSSALVLFFALTHLRKPILPPVEGAIPMDPSQFLSSDLIPRSEAGPWGRLEMTPVQLEIPDDDEAENPEPEPSQSVVTRWWFGKYEPSAVRKVFNTLPLTNPQRESLLDEGFWRYSTEGVMVLPEHHVVMGLSPECRTQLYGLLGRFIRNPRQAKPLVIHPEKLAAWSESGLVSPQTLGLLKSLLYQRGTYTCLADADLLTAGTLVPSAEQKNLKTLLGRVPALSIVLKIGRTDSLEELASYWTSKDISWAEIREAQQRLAPGEELSVDIWQLLPEVPRLLLNTFPANWPEEARLPDTCGLTCFTFAGQELDPRFSDIGKIREELAHNYLPVSGLPKFGDVVFFVSPSGETVHMAIYVAADVFFTKNDNHDSPWVLNHLDRLKEHHTAYPNLQLAIYRLKSS